MALGSYVLLIGYVRKLLFKLMRYKIHLPYYEQARSLAVQAVTVSPTDEALKSQFDFALFGEYVLNLPPADHHLEWIDRLVTGQDSEVLSKVAGSNLRYCAPRGSAKTIWTAVALAWIIGHNPHIRIILVSYSADVALSISVMIKNIIASDFYQQVFPYIRPSRRWRDTQWSIERSLAGVTSVIKDPTLYAVGSAGAIASRRSDLIYIDDPIRSSADISNPAMRQRMVNWFNEVLEPTLVPGGRVLCSATRYRIDDLHGTTFNEDNGWEVLTQPAILLDEDGDEFSFWEDYMSLEFLHERRSKSPLSFASQYQQEPIASEAQIVKPEWVIRGDIPDQFDEVSVGIDLAASKKEQSDYTAVVAVGRLADLYYVISADRGRWSLDETIRFLLGLDYNARRFSFQVESVSFQASFLPEFKRRAKEEGRSIRAEPVVMRGDKEQRLYGVSGLFECGEVIFNRARSFEVLIDELVSFGYTEHDDLVDALVFALQKVFVKRRSSLHVSGYN